MKKAHFVVTGVFGLLWLSVQAAETVYEPFSYSTGALAGNSGGTGMTGSWSSSGSNPYQVASSGLSFGTLPAAGNLVKRTSASGGAESSRAISAASQTALTADNTTIWFSALVRNDKFSTGNEDGSCVLGTGPFDVTGDRNPNTIEGATGQGLGLQVNGNNPSDGTLDIYAYAVDGASDYRSAGKVDNDSSVSIFLIAGKVVWAPNGSNDTLLLFNITDPDADEPVDGDAFATLTIDLDQTQFDTLAICNEQVSSIDEIRLAPTYYEVMGREPPPAAGTVFIFE